MWQFFLQKVADCYLTIIDVVLVTDTVPEMVVLAQLGKYRHVKGNAYMLNLASQRALKLTSVSRLLRRVRQTIMFFQQSTVAKHWLEEKHKLPGPLCHKSMF